MVAITRIKSNLDGLPAGLEISSRSGPRDSFVWLLVEINAFSASLDLLTRGGGIWFCWTRRELCGKSNIRIWRRCLVFFWRVAIAVENQVKMWVGGEDDFWKTPLEAGQQRIGSWFDGCNFGFASWTNLKQILGDLAREVGKFFETNEFVFDRCQSRRLDGVGQIL